MSRIAGRPAAPTYPLSCILALFLTLSGAAALNVGLHYRFPIHAFGAGRPIAEPVASLSTVPQLPFSFDDIVNYLSNAVGKAPHDRQSDYAVFESTAIEKVPLRIAVTRQGSQMLLRFQVDDERGLEVARKFCQAPFFRSDESELLNALLSADEGIHCAISARFDVLCEYNLGPERTVISFFFSPPLRFCDAVKCAPPLSRSARPEVDERTIPGVWAKGKNCAVLRKICRA